MREHGIEDGYDEPVFSVVRVRTRGAYVTSGVLQETDTAGYSTGLFPRFDVF